MDVCCVPSLAFPLGASRPARARECFFRFLASTDHDEASARRAGGWQSQEVTRPQEAFCRSMNFCCVPALTLPSGRSCSSRARACCVRFLASAAHDEASARREDPRGNEQGSAAEVDFLRSIDFCCVGSLALPLGEPRLPRACECFFCFLASAARYEASTTSAVPWQNGERSQEEEHFSKGKWGEKGRKFLSERRPVPRAARRGRVERKRRICEGKSRFEKKPLLRTN
jgi:hypothetical protein